MTTERFLAELRADLIRGDDALEAKLRLDEWVYGPGFPDDAPAEETDAFRKVEGQARAFAEGTAASALLVRDWSTHEWLHFLKALPEALPAERLRALDEAFGLSGTGNSEILFAWLRVAIRNRYEPAFPALERFLTTQGRRKFLRPLYEDLTKTEWGRALALRIYEQARPTYHPVSSSSVDAVLGVSGQP
jgi:hypothetical protein